MIRGALRAEKPDLLTVVLPQSRSKQPPESQELLEQVGLPPCSLVTAPLRRYEYSLLGFLLTVIMNNALTVYSPS